MSKNPCTCCACRSMVRTRFTPEANSKFATSLAVIGTRGWSLRSWRAYPKNGITAVIRSALPRRVHHDQQLHQMLVSGRTGWLNDENVVSSNVFLNFYVRLAVGKRADCGP